MPRRFDPQSRRAPARATADRKRLLYRRDEVAAMFGVSVSTVIRMEADGRLPRHKLVGSKKNSVTLYRAADVHRLAGADAI